MKNEIIDESVIRSLMQASDEDPPSEELTLLMEQATKEAGYALIKMPSLSAGLMTIKSDLFPAMQEGDEMRISLEPEEGSTVVGETDTGEPVYGTVLNNNEELA